MIRTRADEVTAGAETDFAKAVALQDWFREGGGFRYSLEQRSGSGMDLLASLRDRRPGRLLRAVRRGDGRDGPRRWASPRGSWSGSSTAPPSPTGGSSTPATTGTPGRRCTSPASAGCASSRPRPARRRDPVVDPAGRPAAPSRRPPRAPAPARRPPPSRTRRPTDVTADDDQRLPVPWWPVVALLVVLLLGLGARAACAGVQRRRRLAAGDPVHLAEGAWAELRPPPSTSGWTGPSSARRASRRAAWSTRCRRSDEDLGSLEGLLVPGRAGSLRPRPADAGTGRGRRRGRGTRRDGRRWRRVMVGSVDRERGLARSAVAGVAAAAA